MGLCGLILPCDRCLDGDSHQLIDVIPLYIIAEILGIISMVPGGLGSFDVFMILELTHLGVSSELAVVWILFFRLFYYIVPFILGGVFFVHDMGHQINEN